MFLKIIHTTSVFRKEQSSLKKDFVTYCQMFSIQNPTCLDQCSFCRNRNRKYHKSYVLSNTTLIMSIDIYCVPYVFLIVFKAQMYSCYKPVHFGEEEICCVATVTLCRNRNALVWHRISIML